MKKSMFLITVIVLCLSACGKEEPKHNNENNPQAFQESKYNDIPSSFKEGKMDVEIKFEKDTYDVKSQKITYTIINKGEELLYGNPYEIEQFKNGSWKKIPFKQNIGFTSIGRILPKGKTAKKTINFEILNANLKPGYYRVIDKFYLNEDVKKEVNLSSIFQLK